MKYTFAFASQLLGILLFTLAFSSISFGQKLQMKVVVEARSQENQSFEKPCFLIFPERAFYDGVDLSLSSKLIKQALEDKGYHIFDDPRDAEVIVKIDYLLADTFEAEVTYMGRPSIDYSHSSSTRNYASTTSGGRYSMLSSPEYNRASNASESILGPRGEIIELWKQKSYAAEIKEGTVETRRTNVYPLFFQICAYHFDETQLADPPIVLWQVNASHYNLQPEELESQLDQLAKVSVRSIGKSLVEPKHVARKGDSSCAWPIAFTALESSPLLATRD